MYPIQIIGMGQGRQDLTEQHLSLIKHCDILVGGKRLLDLFADTQAETMAVNGHVDRLIQTLESQMETRKIVVLASGDPLFHGIGSTFIRYFDPDKICIHPNVSSIAAAFAAIKEPWDDALSISLHGSHQPEISFSRLADENKIAFLTDPQKDPKYIARQLEKEGLYDFKVCVLECLGDPDRQKITWFDNIDQVYRASFSQPNIVILKKTGRTSPRHARETYVGMDDSLFRHSKGLITKSEIRSVSLSKLKLLRKDHVLWDIGSGSGSVGIEASFQIPWGHVYAIEKNPARISDIIQNIRNFDCSNVKVVNAAFPDGMDELKPPDRIFIGGGGDDLEQVLTVACEKLADFGVIVVNTVLIQNLNTAIKVMQAKKLHPGVVQIQVSRSKSMPFGERFEALNPVWIVSASKAKK
jgi:precorrin-6Y C5,15-methyltransferase (decarboxylating)